MPRPKYRSESDDRSSEQLSSPPTGQPVDVVVLRNYDHWEGHSIEVTVATAPGEPLLHERCYLQPGRSTSLSATIDPGNYQLRVLVDGVERSRQTYHLDDTPHGTAVIELGNGVVSVTHGTTATA